MGALIRRAAEIAALAGGVLLIAILLVTSTNVGAFIANRVAGLWGGSVGGLPGYEDFVRRVTGAAVLMFFPYAQLCRGHVAVDFFTSFLPKGWSRLLDQMWTALTILLALFLAGWMALGMIQARADRLVTGVLGWPDWPFYLPGVLSLCLWAAVAALQLRESA